MRVQFLERGQWKARDKVKALKARTDTKVRRSHPKHEGKRL